MVVVEKVKEMQKIIDSHRSEGKRIVCVPTMGYFHKGHLSLMELAREYGEIVVTTLFVNPTQFGPNEDFERYPRNFQRDFELAQSFGIDYLFAPKIEEMYPDNFYTKVIVGKFTDKFEGVKRPGHFDGVATVVTKLFNATKPDVAIFGQKDFQQALVIKQLVKELLFDIKIIVAPIVREADGLAMSSRNVYLSEEERKLAPRIFEALNLGIKAVQNGERRRKQINSIVLQHLRQFREFFIDYVAAVDSETLDEPEEFSPGQTVVILVAVYLGKTRLIDNVLVTVP
ncbi:pantoate--beta-alanine ligase [Bacteroidetes/Chlorobi group bacterium MS-B_bin-24]|nr:MAG: pantoate--beta-alanine ligase [Bacteroidetes/Chlorobi group bacterium MS-B_bin-24]